MPRKRLSEDDPTVRRIFSVRKSHLRWVDERAAHLGISASEWLRRTIENAKRRAEG